MKNHSVKEHYENLLAKHYSWMFGDFDEQVQKNQDWFKNHGIQPHSSKKVIDLGAGSGFQSLALSSLGFEVTAVDFNSELLAELQSRDPDGTIDVIQGNILEPKNYLGNAPFELAICMGDTLPHLHSLQSVSDLFENTSKLLEPKGKLILSFRDLSVELTGTDRFIPVQSDADKVMTVFLEYKPDHVYVHDLINVRENDSWKLEKSVYKKLRLSSDRVEHLIKKANFGIDRIQADRGMIYMIATKL